jgi:hypothetical protein
VINCTLNYVRNFCVTYGIKRNLKSKRSAEFSMHNSERCETVLKLDLERFFVCLFDFGPLCMLFHYSQRQIVACSVVLFHEVERRGH